MKPRIAPGEPRGLARLGSDSTRTQTLSLHMSVFLLIFLSLLLAPTSLPLNFPSHVLALCPHELVPRRVQGAGRAPG